MKPNLIEVLISDQSWYSPLSMGRDLHSARYNYKDFLSLSKIDPNQEISFVNIQQITKLPLTSFVFKILNYQDDYFHVEIPPYEVKWNGRQFNGYHKSFWTHKNFCQPFTGKLCLKCGFSCRQHCPQRFQLGLKNGKI